MTEHLLPRAESPTLSVSTEDQAEIFDLYERMRRRRVKLISPDGHSVTLPDSLYTFLCRLLADLSDGKCVSIVQGQAELTTVEAAAILGVSRQFLVNLLNKNEIQYHMVGTHRRVYVQDLLEYKSKRNIHRNRLLDQMAAEAAADGMYDSSAAESTDTGPG